jgi:hypothetical protein
MSVIRESHIVYDGRPVKVELTPAGWLIALMGGGCVGVLAAAIALLPVWVK